ncbi:LOW QUALITY PROTEIN: serpin B9-like [Octodon degus]|uniref:LOW QUALITY PROTEIN: serpin B9-like n=1 Tax=Octodon degus TaxID=10160 RepID=A0A6P3VAC0_OCTDE|nr:LOW QUALITY PROTEIN: serpin B9-like [Octodon degus]
MAQLDRSRAGDRIMSILLEASGAFATSILKVLGQEDPVCSVFFSLVSISFAMGMVLLGAKGSLVAEMAQARALNTEKDIHGGFQSLLTQVHKSGDPFSFSIANKLFSTESFELLSSFQESCLTFYQGKQEQLSFAQAPESSRKHINVWVFRKTGGKIYELLEKHSVHGVCRLVLINVVYFKGRWQEQFEKSSTMGLSFKINQQEQRPVQMMCEEAMYPCAQEREVLELPYKGQGLSMVLLRLDKCVDLSKVEKALTFEQFQIWTSPEFMKRNEVQVCLPRFKLEEEYDMGSVLWALGILDVFHLGKADLSGMSPDSDLCLSKFMHKSVVEVNGEGMEVAAVSSCMVENYCDNKGRPEFCTDRPFLFFIRHNRTDQSLLCCGRFSSHKGCMPCVREHFHLFPQTL